MKRTTNAIDELDKQELNEWRQSVESDFQLLPEGANLVILLGRSYVDAIHRPLARHDGAIAFPFEETSGIGDQMHWLSEHLNQASTTDCSFLFHTQSNIEYWE